MKTRLMICAAILALLCISSRADDKKKHFVVRAGAGVQQVNNHPWAYTTPGQASTNCSTNGTVNATGTTVGNTTDVYGTTNANTNCNTTYRPAQTTTGNRVTVDNASCVTDINSGDQYLIQCTAGWAGSKCSYLNEGEFKAALEGNNMWITGMKGMKEMTTKFHVLRYIPSNSTPSSGPPSVSSQSWTEDEKFTWSFYNSLSEEDKNYIREFCPANPQQRALLPRASIVAGKAPERSLSCYAWISAKAKLQA